MIILTVIIPYFQRRQGILRRALVSVLAQEFTSDVVFDIIVVDDGSPIPSKNEVADLVFAPPFGIRIIEQANEGIRLFEAKS